MTKNERVELFRLVEELQEVTERAGANIDMLYQFIKNKDEIHNLSIKGIDYIADDTFANLELISMKFHSYQKKINDEYNKSTN